MAEMAKAAVLVAPGKFEIKENSPKKLNSPLTGEEILVPSFKMIRFYPTRSLKERIKGLRSGSKKRLFGSSIANDYNEDDSEEYDENMDDENIIECEE